LDLKYANADEAHAAQILHTLWREVGAKGIAAEEAHFKDDGQDDLCEKRRIAASLFTPQILLAGVHVGWIQWTQAWRSAERQNLSHVGQAGWSEGFVRGLRDAWESRRSPYQRESFGQLARELGVALQELPLTTTQAGEALRRYRLWPEAQGAWPLRYALATEAQAASGKPLTPDGPRYKALGNSMAVPVMRWIGERIHQQHRQDLASQSPEWLGDMNLQIIKDVYGEKPMIEEQLKELVGATRAANDLLFEIKQVLVGLGASPTTETPAADSRPTSPAPIPASEAAAASAAAPPSPAAADPADSEVGPTKADVMAALRELDKAKGKSAVQGVLAQFKARNLTSLDAEKYAAVIEAAQDEAA
jgi:hypothetical protein